MVTATSPAAFVSQLEQLSDELAALADLAPSAREPIVAASRWLTAALVQAKFPSLAPPSPTPPLLAASNILLTTAQACALPSVAQGRLIALRAALLACHRTGMLTPVPYLHRV